MVKSMFPRGPIVLFCLTMTLMIVWGVGVYLHWPGRSGSDLVLYVLAFFLIMMLSVLFFASNYPFLPRRSRTVGAFARDASTNEANL